MTGVEPVFEWEGTSPDPNDEQFGDVVTACSTGGRSGAEDLPSILGLDAFDVALLGEPFDAGVIGRAGARGGPDALRTALASLKTHHFSDGPLDCICDVGDVVLAVDEGTDTPTSVVALQRQVRTVTERLHESDALPIFLGGDNSLTVPNVSPLLDSGRVGVVTVDAHLDVREVRADATSGTPYRQLYEAGLDGYVCVGARHFETSTRYADFVDDRGGAVVTAETVGDDPPGAADRALDALGDVDRVYVSLDLDVLDAAVAPGVSAPTPGGLTTRELFGLLTHVARDDRIAGFEVVECAPRLDVRGRTAAAGARAVAHFVSGYAATERNDD